MKTLLVCYIVFFPCQLSFSSYYNQQYWILANKYAWMTPQLYHTIKINAHRYGHNPRLITAIIERESSGDANEYGAAGEYGLMQVKACHYPEGVGRELFEPGKNIMAGCRYLKQCRIASKGNLRETLRRYNQGCNGKRERYKHWKDYVDRIIGNL